MLLEIDETKVELHYVCNEEGCSSPTMVTDLSNIIAVGNPICPECGEEMDHYRTLLQVTEE